MVFVILVFSMRTLSVALACCSFRIWLFVLLKEVYPINRVGTRSMAKIKIYFRKLIRFIDKFPLITIFLYMNKLNYQNVICLILSEKRIIVCNILEFVNVFPLINCFTDSSNVLI